MPVRFLGLGRYKLPSSRRDGENHDRCHICEQALSDIHMGRDKAGFPAGVLVRPVGVRARPDAGAGVTLSRWRLGIRAVASTG